MNSGWQQPPVPRPVPIAKCSHLGAVFAGLTVFSHAEGHEWICPCGQVFVVVSDGGRNKHLVKKVKRP